LHAARIITPREQVMDWAHVFGFETSWIELVVRGSAMYWFLFVLFRLVLRRDTGAVGMADVLVLVLIADAAQNGISGDYRSVPEGMVVVGTIVGWTWLLDFAAARSARLRRLLQPPEVLLVRDGEVLQRNLRRESMSLPDLLAKLREHGIEDPHEVRRAYMEANGEISVVRRRD
jgi:uncharacterized membrane protein YcaP (DUF421 family)